MIDPNLPLELDDGTPVELDPRYEQCPGQVSIYVRVPKYSRNGPPCAYVSTFSYYLETGNWCGDSGKAKYRIRNVIDVSNEPEDWS